MPLGQNSNNPYLSQRFVAPGFGQPGQPIQLPGGGVLMIPPEGLTQAEYDVLSGIRAGNPVGGPFAQQVIDSLAQYGYLQPGAGEVYGSAGQQVQNQSGPPINQPPPGSPTVSAQSSPGPTPDPGPAPGASPLPPMGVQPSGPPLGYAPSAGAPTSGAPQNQGSRRERALAQAAAFQAANPGSNLSRGWYERHDLDYPTPQSSEPSDEPGPTGTQTPPINPNPMPQPPRWGSPTPSDEERAAAGFGPVQSPGVDIIGSQRRKPGPGTQTPPINPRPRYDPRQRKKPGGTQTPPINPGPTGGTQTPPIDPRKRYDSALSGALR